MALVPAEQVKVPVMVWFAVTLMIFRPAEMMPVKDRLLKVLALRRVAVPSEVLVKDTL